MILSIRYLKLMAPSFQLSSSAGSGKFYVGGGKK